jgi:YtcA-like protein
VTLALLSLDCISLTGCSAGGAPSFTLFGAFFPAWLLCGLIGVAGAGAARAAFVATGLANALPYQLLVCAAAGVIAATLAWLIWFGG